MTRMRTAAALVGLALAAVGGSVSQARDDQKAPPCNPSDPESCLYVSDQSFTPALVEGIRLADPGRHNYPVPLLVRYPSGAAGPRPVVIWNHGGDPSANGRFATEDWSDTFAAAGYVVIQIARVLPADLAPVQGECRQNGFKTPQQCAFWTAQMRYGPQNIHFVIDHLDDIEAADPALAGLLDESRIVVAG